MSSSATPTLSTEGPMTRILLADDHPVVREGLKKTLSRGVDLEVVAEAETSPEALRLATEEDIDVIVLDLDMPGRGGLSVLKELRDRDPDVRVVVVSMYPVELYGPRALKAGALAYLSKSAVPEHLLAAVAKAAQGQRYTTPELADILAARLGNDADPEAPHAILSDRELQVLKLMARGNAVSDIADQLALSPQTVSTYRRRLLEKTGLENNAQLIRYALEKELD